MNGQSIAWALAKDYDVHVLGLQSFNKQKIDINIHSDKRRVTEHPNLPRGNNTWDFGTKSLPRLLNDLQPNVLLTINDIQMIQHVPGVLYPTDVKIRLMDMPSKKLVSKDAIKMQLDAHIQKFKEKYPLDVKWILLGPQDGEPPMGMWKNVYAAADQVVAMCKYGQWVYKNFFNMKVPYIYHGIDTDMFKPTERKQFKNKFVVGNFNRNQPRKQPVRTMKAFAKFAKGKNDVLLHMQMDWNDQFGWPIQYFAGMFGIMNKMVTPAPVGIARNQVAEIYNQWDLNVNTTGGEGFGICEIEGMACGVPNVSTNYTTSKELTIDGKPSPRGMIIPYKELYWEKMDVAAVQRSATDVDELAKIFEIYYNNRNLVEEHGKNGREWTEKYSSMNKIQHKWIALVKDVLNRE